MTRVVGLGEALFDVYPDGARRLGGATLNFAVHAHQLQARIDGCGIPVTRIGNDELGSEVIALLEAFAIDTSAVQRDAARPTGRVLVTIQADGSPQYDIQRGVAWDAIAFDGNARRLAETCDAVCFGTLAQRDASSRAGIQRFLQAAPQALRLCDINLRQTYFDANLVRRSLELATAAKLNKEELSVIAGLLRLPGNECGQIAALIDQFELDYLVLTRGAEGTVIFTSDGAHAGEPASAVPADDADPVGAGDSCAAAVVVALLLGQPPALSATFANRVGAYVASCRGGTPPLPETLLVKPDCTLPL